MEVTSPDRIIEESNYVDVFIDKCL